MTESRNYNWTMISSALDKQINVHCDCEKPDCKDANFLKWEMLLDIKQQLDDEYDKTRT